MKPLHHHTACELGQLLASKTVSSEELTRHFLSRIEQHNPVLNAFIRVTPDIAIEQAQASDARRARGEVRSILDGVPMAHKDLFCTRGVPTTAGSKMLENFIPSYTATIAERLENAGAVMTGKLSMDEFAMGSSNERSYFGAVHNPWNIDHVPGGSSGGSAAAVGARLLPFSTGSDTGGSIR